jgi:hypothetical protein
MLVSISISIPSLITLYDSGSPANSRWNSSTLSNTIIIVGRVSFNWRLILLSSDQDSSMVVPFFTR